MSPASIRLAAVFFRLWECALSTARRLSNPIILFPWITGYPSYPKRCMRVRASLIVVSGVIVSGFFDIICSIVIAG